MKKYLMKTIYYFQHPTDQNYQACQSYYVAGLRGYLNKHPEIRLDFKIQSMQRFPLASLPGLRILRRISRSRLNRYSFLCKLLNDYIEKLSHPHPPGNSYDQHVGQYGLSDSRHHSTHEVGFLIDTHDKPEVRSPQLLEWGELYFKAQYWPGKEYPDRVRPIVRVSPFMSGRIELLRELRSAEKEWDIVHVSKIWGGREHNIRLFEALSKLRCRKYLYAVFAQESDKQYADRLDKAGVRWGFQALPIMDYWQLCASSRLAMVRTGKHGSVPWRVLELLAMGACPVFDHDPFPRWPVPLENGTNYLSLEIARPPDLSPGPVEDYERVPDMIGKILRNDQLLEQVRENNRHYFEKHASPSAVGEYIINTLVECGIVQT
jgi:hypothetical protein